MTLSILHRASGVGLALGGLGILLWWLGALASGPEAYATFTSWVWPGWSALEWSGAGAIFASLVKLALMAALIGMSWAFFNHMSSGIRHFVLDTGAGYELKVNRMGSWISMTSGVVLTAGFWCLLLFV